MNSPLTKEEADNVAKKEAHGMLDMFHNVCDLYNKGDLDDPTKYRLQLKSFQDDAIEAKKLIVFLYEASDCKATRAYMTFAAKILIRLSYLIHNGEKETPLEWYNYFQDFRNKYNMKTPMEEL